jgi:hypothetical protein
MLGWDWVTLGEIGCTQEVGEGVIGFMGRIVETRDFNARKA